ncbi:MAG: hypothetical protein U5K74_11205 [Gemmatimonadaceae bacterium]|nr:hypothetical protein [Gemmatimonadaceae bacterium]
MARTAPARPGPDVSRSGQPVTYSSVFTSPTSFVRLAFASPKSMLVFSS